MENQIIAATYERASKLDQTTEQQYEKNKEYCERNNIKIYKSYAEIGQSGAKESRPQLDLMLKDMRDKKFNCVVVLKYDRLGRSTIHLLQVLEEMKSLGIRLIAVEQNIDTSTPMGKYFVTNLCSLADLEREMIIERTCDKLDYYKKQIKEKGFFINKQGKKCFCLGRPAGSKDKTIRRKGGYYLRWNKN